MNKPGHKKKLLPLKKRFIFEQDIYLLVLRRQAKKKVPAPGFTEAEIQRQRVFSSRFMTAIDRVEPGSGTDLHANRQINQSTGPAENHLVSRKYPTPNADRRITPAGQLISR